MNRFVAIASLFAAAQAFAAEPSASAQVEPKAAFEPGAAFDGLVTPNALRGLVRGKVAPKRLGAFAHRALSAGIQIS